MEIVLLWFVLAVLVGVWASRRGRSAAGGTVISLIFSPLIGALAVAAIGPAQSAAGGPTPDTHVKCPDCAELVLREARVCRHCGCRLRPQ